MARSSESIPNHSTKFTSNQNTHGKKDLVGNVEQ